MLTQTVLITLQLFVSGFFIDKHDVIAKGEATEAQNSSQNKQAASPEKAALSQQALAYQAALQMKQVRVYPLKHALADSLANGLRKFLPLFPFLRIYSDNRTNSIVILGSEENIEIIVKIMKAIDEPPKKKVIEEEMVRIPIKYRDAKDVENKLYSLSSSFLESLRISVDKERSTIFLTGPKDGIAKARVILEKLDTPAAMVRLEFAFFQAQPDADTSAQPIPKDLVEVADELKRFGHITLVGRLSTIAVEARPFNVSGQISEQLFARVEGRLLSAISEDAVKVELESKMMLFKPSGEAPFGTDNQQSHSNFDLETVVTTRTGDYVVLGSAPSGWSAGESAILVLQVLP